MIARRYPSAWRRLVPLLLVASSTASTQTLAESILTKKPAVASPQVVKRIEPETVSLAGLNVLVWRPVRDQKPETRSPAPLVIFSHGFGGSAGQSRALMSAIAAGGYIVFAPDHRDAHGSKATMYRPEISFHKAAEWSDTTYWSRHEDIVNLLSALKKNPEWNGQIDFSRMALVGHSLGGYTALGLGGAWPRWKIDGIKAIVALSPYTYPYLLHGDLSHLGVPVLYEGGSHDFSVTPAIIKPGGAWEKTASPAYFVKFEGAGHLAWTNFNHREKQLLLIDRYTLAFLDKYIHSDERTQNSEPEEKSILSIKAEGVADLQSK